MPLTNSSGELYVVQSGIHYYQNNVSTFDWVRNPHNAGMNLQTAESVSRHFSKAHDYLEFPVTPLDEAIMMWTLEQ